MATLEDHLRRATRNATIPLPESDVLGLGLGLARELARAHAETPPRHPEMEPASIALEGGAPRLTGGGPAGAVAEDLFQLGCLLHAAATATVPDVSWRLDGPRAEPGGFLFRSLVEGLASPRRERRFASAEAAVRAFESALASDADAAHPWPLFRGDAARRGAAGASTAGRLSSAWEAGVGSVVASPVLTASLVLAVTSDGRLLFVERASGRLVHELRLGTAVESSPAVLAGELHVGTDDGEWVAVDVARGAIARRLRLGQVVRSSPLPLADRVVVGIVEPRGAGSLAAVERATGTLAWKLKLKPVFSSPALSGSRVLVGSDDGSLHAVDLAKGALAWSHALGAKVRATPAVSDALAVVGDFEGRLVAVARETGERAWSAELGAALYSSPALAAGLAVVGANDGRVHGVDLATGAVRFVTETRGPVVASPVASGEIFLVGSTDGDLYEIDAAGAVLGRTSLASGGIASSPALDGDLVVVGSARGLHALRRA